MSDCYIGEIRAVAFDFAPRNWALCNGQLLAIAQNQALFSLLGTTYGGNGTTTFALPNLQGRVPIHYGNGIQLGQSEGTENHTLTSSEIPWHTHSLSGSSNSPAVQSPASAYLPSNSTALPYAPSADSYMSGQTMSSVGGQPHPNMPPYLVMNYVIAINGLFPPRN